jgi:phospholipid/cholesterol/gamma-HCH transport system substrate-binding protein
MRRILAICGALGVAGSLVFGLGAGGETDDYEVRAIFDNGAFLVPGEEVRIAGARVGTVGSVDVTREDEAAHADGTPEPGKAVVVLRIDDEGFQDFRTDASCLIRPQSLLGEKYVACEPTQPRAGGSEPLPPLATIPEGEAGAGQHFLPLESNGKAVDLDLVQNIMREPYPDRFRLILNDLGAGLAARGPDLAAVIERANPALRETDEVLAALARQSGALRRLATDADAALAPLAREREHVSGFINNAEVTAAAAATRSPELEAGLERLPGTLRELQPTMRELAALADQATPVFADLGDAAPALTDASRALVPFAPAATSALTSLGDAAEQSGELIADSDPVLKDVRDLAQTAKPGAESLATLLASLRRTGGFERLADFIFYGVGGINGFDQYGHYLRALLLVTACVQYVSTPILGCSSRFDDGSTGKTAVAAKAPPLPLQDEDTPEPQEDMPQPEDDTSQRAERTERALRALLEYGLGPAEREEKP